MVPRLTREEALELAWQPTEARWALMLSATATGLWVVAREDARSAPGPRCLWSKQYPRPEGTTPGDCLRAGITALFRASHDGRLALP